MNSFLRIIKIHVILILILFFLSNPTNAWERSANYLLDGLEASIGNSAKDQILEMYGGIFNLPLSDHLFITEIFNRLVAVTDRDVNYSLTVLNSPKMNAFALPGGYVFVTRGLQKILSQDEHRLAAVLAHEIAHVELRHGLNSVLRQLGFTVLMELGIYHFDVPFNKAMRMATLALVDVLQSGYSREAEFEADHLGQKYLAEAGFDPAGGILLLADLMNLETNNIPNDIFSTHPPSIERINKLQKDLLQYWSVLNKPNLLCDKEVDPGVDPLGRFVLKEELNEAGYWEIKGYDYQREISVAWLPNVEARYPTWAPQGKQLAIAVKEQEVWEIWLLNRIGNMITKVDDTILGEPANLRFSPDGSMIAYNCFKENGDSQIIINYVEGDVQLDVGQGIDGLILEWGSQGILIHDEKNNEYYLIEPPVVKPLVAVNPVPKIIERKSRMTPIVEQNSNSGISLTRPNMFDF